MTKNGHIDIDSTVVFALRLDGMVAPGSDGVLEFTEKGEAWLRDWLLKRKVSEVGREGQSTADEQPDPGSTPGTSIDTQILRVIAIALELPDGPGFLRKLANELDNENERNA